MIPEIITTKRGEIEAICRKHQVQELFLFGSMLRGDYTDSSDVDVLVTFKPEADPDIGYFDIFRLQDDLEDVFGRDVDIGTVRSLKPMIRESVLNTAQVLYAG
ncbi:MAG: nucleotidyltransferase domain-containing protein [Acidobacteria bacterium]|nr:nucleotidyltransferase domain-containing protein [Acidobacteriota bacterium]